MAETNRHSPKVVASYWRQSLIVGSLALSVVFKIWDELPMDIPESVAISSTKETQWSNATKNSVAEARPPEFYNNLSCPFEWSKYSCTHQNNFERATASLAYIMRNWRAIPMENIGVQRRLLLVGDSSMRQVFIALGCQFWMENAISSHSVDWLRRWPCHGTKNCVPGGVHSGFNTGSVILNNRSIVQEIHYIPHSGSLKKNEMGILRRWANEWNDTKSITFGSNLAIPKAPNSILSAHDIVVFNLGFHFDRQRVELLQLLDRFGRAVVQTPGTFTLIYMKTFTQHFQTTDGSYSLLPPPPPPGCQNTTQVNARQRHEMLILREGVNVDSILDAGDSDLGYLHIGGVDCTHYCIPGVPDIVARKLVNQLHSLPFEGKQDKGKRST